MNESTMELSKLLPIIAPLFVIQLILVIVALVALAKASQTRGPKWLWVLVIVFVNIIGPVLFFVVGRRND
ncbi:PLD nuclease N-terminal domain-containing protein [Paenibacillus radicis (ex Gao et al. 2016)]|uniref:Negative regulatory protein YxlE n=1 Tax=Paenibacillus radicis (ex Gao et al. 2016) TaxID=1737354 RepID=A0A917HJ54_9BACL|nr:PLD nuclease N-terminal domain-containing protein [Paenibacillus radicis (ex Gao et al. 2016)]GGG81265.1 negative regulatory protein YxlE [Paenibacillus radicis (ex Gao et al. 2016)]